jgi:hypothetical protein
LTATPLLLTGTFLSLLLVPTFSLLFVVILFIPLLNGLSNPNLTARISSLRGVKNQGELLGINQSVLALSQFLPGCMAAFGNPATGETSACGFSYSDRADQYCEGLS